MRGRPVVAERPAALSAASLCAAGKLLALLERQPIVDSVRHAFLHSPGTHPACATEVRRSYAWGVTALRDPLRARSVKDFQSFESSRSVGVGGRFEFCLVTFHGGPGDGKESVDDGQQHDDQVHTDDGEYRRGRNEFTLLLSTL